MLEEEARKRQHAGVPEIFPEGAGESREHAARLLGVNSHYISDAKRIAAESPDLIEDVRLGEVSLQEAKRQLLPRVAHNSGDNHPVKIQLWRRTEVAHVTAYVLLEPYDSYQIYQSGLLGPSTSGGSGRRCS